MRTSPDVRYGADLRDTRRRAHCPVPTHAPSPVGLVPAAAVDDVDLEGWQAEADWSGFGGPDWPDNLPTRFLRQGRLVSVRADEVALTGGLRGTMEDGLRCIRLHGVRVLHGAAYLLPWRSRRATTPDKLYHWNPAGGTSCWVPPDPFTGCPAFEQHALTDDGPELVDVVAPGGGRLTLRAGRGVAYVLRPIMAS